jgi:dephospho-CoA kinase
MTPRPCACGLPDRANPPAAAKPKVIGLTGGIASGKSTVAKMFARLGAAVIDADAIAREALLSREVSEKLRKYWGKELFDGKRPNRARVAQVAFGDPEKLRELTAWVHPPVIREMRAQLDRALTRRRVPLVVVDAPLLIEADLAAWCDLIVFVDAARAVRAGRARSARGWPEQEIRRRESAQASLAEKRRRASARINNNGSEEKTRASVSRLFHVICDGGAKSPRGK